MYKTRINILFFLIANTGFYGKLAKWILRWILASLIYNVYCVSERKSQVFTIPVSYEVYRDAFLCWWHTYILGRSLAWKVSTDQKIPWLFWHSSWSVCENKPILASTSSSHKNMSKEFHQTKKVHLHKETLSCVSLGNKCESKAKEWEWKKKGRCQKKGTGNRKQNVSIVVKLELAFTSKCLC